MLTPYEYSNKHGISLRKVYDMIAKGKLLTTKVPKTVIERKVIMILEDVKG